MVSSGSIHAAKDTFLFARYLLLFWMWALMGPQDAAAQLFSGLEVDSQDGPEHRQTESDELI